MGFQVGTGGERVAGSGDDGDAKRGVITEVTPHLTHQLVGFDVDGVLDFWAVEGDVGDLTALLVEHLCGHAGSLVRVVDVENCWWRGPVESVERAVVLRGFQFPPPRLGVGRPAVNTNAGAGDEAGGR